MISSDLEEGRVVGVKTEQFKKCYLSKQMDDENFVILFI